MPYLLDNVGTECLSLPNDCPVPDRSDSHPTGTPSAGKQKEPMPKDENKNNC